NVAGQDLALPFPFSAYSISYVGPRPDHKVSGPNLRSVDEVDWHFNIVRLGLKFVSFSDQPASKLLETLPGIQNAGLKVKSHRQRDIKVNTSLKTRNSIGTLLFPCFIG